MHIPSLVLTHFLLPFTLATISSLPCPIPATTNLYSPFTILLISPSNPLYHNRSVNFWAAGGTDKHLYLSPTPSPNDNTTLIDGVLTNWDTKTLRGVINGEYTTRDNTTKFFFTQRADPRAVFEMWEGCEENIGGSKLYFTLKDGGVRDGGNICVRAASGGRFELRWSPKGNTIDAGCDHVTLVPKFTNGIPPREVNCDGTVRYDGAAVDCPSTPISKPEYGRGWRPLGVR